MSTEYPHVRPSQREIVAQFGGLLVNTGGNDPLDLLNDLQRPSTKDRPNNLMAVNIVRFTLAVAVQSQVGLLATLAKRGLDDDRAEAWDEGARATAHAAEYLGTYPPNPYRAAGRAETTTATTEDVRAEVERLLLRHGHAEWTEHDARTVAKVLDSAGLLATARPDTTTEPTDAQVLAALNAMHPKAAAPSLDYWGDKSADEMRAALRAALSDGSMRQYDRHNADAITAPREAT